MAQVSEISVKDAAGVDRDVATLTAIAAILGEVQASPTANTVLNRLKALLTGISLAAGTANIGVVSTKGKYVDVTLGSLETSAISDGEVMCATTEVTGAFFSNDGTGVIQSIQVLDEDDEGAPFDLVFMSANRSLGTANSAPNISDSDARDILGRVRVNASDYIDIGGAKMATLTGIGLGVKSGTGVDDMWVGAIARASVTYTAATDLKLRIYIAND